MAEKMSPQIPPSSQSSEPVLVRYGLAIAAVLAALGAAHFLNGSVGTPLPYILLFPTVAMGAWFCGLQPAAISALIAVLGLRYWFVLPSHCFQIPNRTQCIYLVAFSLSCAAVIALGELRRREYEMLRRAQGDLEQRVRERTAELDTANSSLRDLSARLLQLQDEERRRLARELHDSVGQLLVGLSMNLAAVRSDIDRLNKTAVALTDSEALVQEMSKEVRTISHLLHPPLLDEAGLDSAIRWYVDGFAERSKIAVDLSLPDGFGRLPREVETAIFRVVQECLTNIHRHSGTSTAKVYLHRRDGEVLVEVHDQGRGIPLEKREKISVNGTPGVGIRGMRERLRQLGGNLEISSNGRGTTVLARLPVTETSPLTEDPIAPDKSSTTAA